MAKEETAAALQKGVDVGEFAVGVRGLHTESKQDPSFFTPNLSFCQLPTKYLCFFLQGMDLSLFKSAYEAPKFNFLLSHAAYCRDVLKLKKGQRAVISNGRVSQKF